MVHLPVSRVDCESAKSERQSLISVMTICFQAKTDLSPLWRPAARGAWRNPSSPNIRDPEGCEGESLGAMRDSPVQRKAPWAVNGFGSTFFHKKVEERRWHHRRRIRLVGLALLRLAAKTNKGNWKHIPTGEHRQRVSLSQEGTGNPSY